MSKKAIVVTLILLIGTVFRFALTANGNFIFNIDNARDMVDVREIVILKKLRLTGPNTPIPGLYNGPAWYYLLAVPFILTAGDPYGSIVMQIILWAIGGFFLLKLVSRFGMLSILSVGSLWIASNFIVLANLYAFNPNPVMFLTPLLIYLIEKYITSQKLVYGALMWFLTGLFFNFEMNFGIFVPLIIFFSILFTKKTLIIKSQKFWIGVLFFILCLLPQLIFDLKHQFIMSKGILLHLQRDSGRVDFSSRFSDIAKSFYGVFVPTMLNMRFLSISILFLSIPPLFKFLKREKKDSSIIIALLFIFLPFFIYLFLPVAVNPWHLGGAMAATVILLGFVLKELYSVNQQGKLASIILSLLISIFAIKNIINFFVFDMGKPNMDPSLFRNEIKAIDYVYQYANGQNFQVYTYLPSVYDYPYQYLFWWYGNKKYGYIPYEYAYAPNKPKYIPSQEKFQGRKDNFSHFVFLIKEPDRNDTRSGWEGEFINLVSLEKQMVGPIEIEIKKE